MPVSNPQRAAHVRDEQADLVIKLYMPLTEAADPGTGDVRT